MENYFGIVFFFWKIFKKLCEKLLELEMVFLLVYEILMEDEEYFFDLIGGNLLKFLKFFGMFGKLFLRFVKLFGKFYK